MNITAEFVRVHERTRALKKALQKMIVSVRYADSNE